MSFSASLSTVAENVSKLLRYEADYKKSLTFTKISVHSRPFAVKILLRLSCSSSLIVEADQSFRVSSTNTSSSVAS